MNFTLGPPSAAYSATVNKRLENGSFVSDDLINASEKSEASFTPGARYDAPQTIDSCEKVVSDISSQTQLLPLDPAEINQPPPPPPPAVPAAGIDGANSPWGSLWIANVVLFLVSVQFSIFFSSLYPYLAEVQIH